MKKILSIALLMTLPFFASAQAMYFNSATEADDPQVVTDIDDEEEEVVVVAEEEGIELPDSLRIEDGEILKPFQLPMSYYEALFTPVDSVRTLEELHEFLDTLYIPYNERIIVMDPLPHTFFGPAVYEEFFYPDTTSVFKSEYSGNDALRWIEIENAQARNMRRIRYDLFFNNPSSVHYNITTLPEAPKKFHAVVNPEDHTITISETIQTPTATTVETIKVKRKHWIQKFNSTLNISQAYSSPNWYQGGNNNSLTSILNLSYNVNLNELFHPKLLFTNAISYNLGVNNAPNDQVHDYLITSDLFQVNSTFGLKAIKKWYYTCNLVFKTQLLNSYNANSENLRSAFMSPGYFNFGIGMTYDYSNKKNTFTFHASINPLSYNLTSCINEKMNVKNYGIEEGRKMVDKFGGFSTELTMNWKVAYNINYSGRIFGYTDYKTAYCDWQNKIYFSINKYLNTTINIDLRYDTQTRSIPDEPKWKKLQIRENLSFGLSYNFSSI